MSLCVIHVCDVMEGLRRVPDASVQCCVTSPPYWGLRDYGAAGQMGLEKTFPEYLEKMVAVFEEVRRVLRKDGTLWLNMGDGYATGEMGGFKPKDLIGQPWRLAFALQAAGWWLRSDIIWAKNNPMPESITDRPTKSHEYVFLLAKSERYFFDQEAVREARKQGKFPRLLHPGGRNIRTVWTIPTQPFPEAHFATFPEELPRRCIKAGSSEGGCCAKCGAPYARVIETGAADLEHQKAPAGWDLGPGAHGKSRTGRYKNKGPGDYADAKAQDPSDVKARILEGMRRKRTLGFEPTCRCGAGKKPCVVLDPFGGSGTTGMVALELGRDAALIELNADYAAMAKRRIETAAPLLNRVELSGPQRGAA